MVSRVVVGITSKLKWLKARVREVINDGRNGGLKGSSHFIRLIMYSCGEGSNSTTESRRASSGHAAQKHLLDGSTLKQAVAKLMDCVNQGIFMNSYAYNHVLQWCSKEKDLESVKQVHDPIKDSQMEQHPFVANMLLKCYLDCGRLDTARELFNKLLKKDTVTWNIIIAGCAKHDQAEGAIELFKQMHSEGGQRNAITYLSVLKACTSPNALKWGKYIHAHTISDGYQADVRICNALVRMYARCGSIEDARAVFARLGRRDLVSWNVMIAGLAEHGLGHEAFSLFLQMQREGFAPDGITYVSILNPCSSPGALQWVKEVHAHAMRAGPDIDVRVGNAIVHMYAKSGRIEDARAVFGSLVTRDVVSWNVMIGGLAEHGLGHDAFSLFLEMQREGFKPDAFTYMSILNPCSSTGAIDWVKKVHAHAMSDGFDADVRVCNGLVHMYGKSGSIEDARRVFDRMRRRNVISWNAIIGGLAEHGLGHEAFSLFLEMQREGLTPDAITYMSILNPCSSAGGVEWLKEVHAHAMRAGLDGDVRVGNALVQMYGRSGSIEDARALFKRMGERNIRSWNVIIGGLAEHALGHEAFSLFLQMQREGFTPDAVTYMSILNPCSSTGSVEWVKEVHAHAMRVGLDVDVRVGTALVQIYSRSGSIEDARGVFDRMGRRNVICWNVMIGGLAEHGLGHEAFNLFRQMQSEGLTPDAVTYMSVLNPCSSAGAIEWVREVHTHAVRAGLEVDVRVGNALVQMYSKSGSIEDARAVFKRMGRRNLVSWNVMIDGLAEHGLGLEAFSSFLEMQREGLTPDAITYMNILNPSSSTGALEWVKEVHAHSMRTGLDVDVRVGNALVQMYSRSGSIKDARAVFDKMGRRNIRSWNMIIGGLAEHGLGRDAFLLFIQMQREQFLPDVFTYMSILNPRSSTGALEWVREVHTHAMRAGLDVDMQLGTAFIQIYAKAGLIADAKQVFDNMQIRDVISWAVFINGIADHGQGREALQLFEEMKWKGVKPNDVLFVSVLSACSHAGLLDEGRLLFASMKRDHGVEPALEHYTCMVDMLGRAGHLEEAKFFILNMPIKPDVVTWTAFLGACRTHRNIELAELAAKECVKLNPTDAAPYVLLSNVYAAVGNWDQVSFVRGMMQEKGISKDPGRCWIEVNNKVHHFSVGDTSHPETREIYAFLSSSPKKLKAEGYIADTRLVLRNIAEEDKENAICCHSEKLAIAYGLMHVSPGKPVRIYKNLRICTDCHAATKVISKITKREIVARDASRFHHFKDGSCSCGDYW